MSYLIFLKRKRTGDVEARRYVRGRPQREYISKELSSPPTVSSYVLYISCAMDAIKGHKVVTYDIPGACLQANWLKDNDYHLKTEILMVKMMCEIDPSYKK